MNLLAKFLGADLGQKDISPLAQFLTQFDQQQPQKSASQLSEINKFKRIINLRDQALYHPPKDISF
jgi:hypothetical protein